MAYTAKVLCDSVSPDGVRLTTLEVTFPRIVLAEFNTHRVFSRNSASSRAIPVEKMLKRVQEDPFVPVWWGKNQKGMQAAEELSDESDRLDWVGDKPDKSGVYSSPRSRAKVLWFAARRSAAEAVKRLQEADIDLHKQIANRLLEPFLWHTVIVTATEWDNWDGLRCNPDAQPEIRRVAEMMRDVLSASQPDQKVERFASSSWHRPLVTLDEFLASPGGKHPADSEEYRRCCDYWNKVSVGRCARVSYLTHDGRRDPDADVQLCERLQASGHMSPFEHVARPASVDDVENVLRGIRGVVGIDKLDIDVTQHFFGNFRGWVQLRKHIPHEDNFKLASQGGNK